MVDFRAPIVVLALIASSLAARADQVGIDLDGDGMDDVAANDEDAQAEMVAVSAWMSATGGIAASGTGPAYANGCVPLAGSVCFGGAAASGFGPATCRRYCAAASGFDHAACFDESYNGLFCAAVSGMADASCPVWACVAASLFGDSSGGSAAVSAFGSASCHPPLCVAFSGTDPMPFQGGRSCDGPAPLLQAWTTGGVIDRVPRGEMRWWDFVAWDPAILAFMPLDGNAAVFVIPGWVPCEDWYGNWACFWVAMAAWPGICPLEGGRYYLVAIAQWDESSIPGTPLGHTDYLLSTVRAT